MRSDLKFCWIIFLGLLLYSCQQYKNEYIPLTSLAQHPNGMLYVGMETCVECHPEIVKSHLLTAHYKTSKKTAELNYFDQFLEANNKVILSDGASLIVRKEGAQFFQEAYAPGLSKPLYKKSMDVVIGSGKKIGQTFLSWEENSLFQLQASHFSPLNQWINSPGYGSFLSPKRPIFPRCMECHSTYAQPENPSSAVENNRYVKNQIIYGIDCQRCHGPVVNHIKHHRNNPLDSVGKNILHYNSLNRSQRIDMCALCHGGTELQNSQKSFSFQLGDQLNDYTQNVVSAESTPIVEVHANQVGLLRSSPCFQQSKKMDCMTCHNPHQTETGNGIKFNSICISCHQDFQHQKKHELKKIDASYSNCIGCHMPLQDSSIMKLELEVNNLHPVQVRTHKIGIYH